MGNKPHHGSELSFSACNSKLEKTAKLLGVKPNEFWSLDLLAGKTCPYAKDCKSTVKVDSQGKRSIQDGPNCQFRCYAATAENRLPSIYNLHKRNTDCLKKATRNRQPNSVADLIERNMPPKCRVVRIHTSGDMYSYRYFLAWMEVARRNPSTLFYFYTKALPLIDRYVMTHPEGVNLAYGILSHNVRVTASYGGTHDHLIEEMNIRSVNVVLSEDRAKLDIDDDDSHAATFGPSFSILIHGVQPAESQAAIAWDKIRRTRGNYAKGVATV